MKYEMCPQEAAAAAAVSGSQWSVSLKAHVAQCAFCRDVVRTAQWMQDLAVNTETDFELPDAGVVWWRAQLSDKQRAAERAVGARAWFEIAVAVTMSLGLTALFALDRNLLPDLVKWTAEPWPLLWAALRSMELAAPVFSASSVADISLAAISITWLLLAKD